MHICLKDIMLTISCSMIMQALQTLAVKRFIDGGCVSKAIIQPRVKPLWWFLWEATLPVKTSWWSGLRCRLCESITGDSEQLKLATHLHYFRQLLLAHLTDVIIQPELKVEIWLSLSISASNTPPSSTASWSMPPFSLSPGLCGSSLLAVISHPDSFKDF